jgi:riboflavin synthase
MFTGIIETIGEITTLTKEKENLHIKVKSTLAPELKIDQSVSHNGVCLTVVDVAKDSYIVTAIKETLDKSNLKNLVVGKKINLERAMKLGDRLDGHLVQGHVDEKGVCSAISEIDGSWIFTFQYSGDAGNITVEKGSITVNGVSLTVVNSKKNEFSVAIIPFTYEHTNFNKIEIGDTVNLEFDVIGKYVKKLTESYS